MIGVMTVGGTACGSDESTAGTEVVAAAYPLAYVAAQVGGDTVDVSTVAPPGAEPHDVELTARDVEQLRDADLVLYVGRGFQPAVEDAMRDRPNAVDVLQDSDPVGGDPHVWLDPLRLAAIARSVGERLGRPEAAEDLATRLTELDTAYREGLANCANRVIVTTHASFGYLARRYGLEQVALAGLAPEAEPSARELERLADTVNRAGGTTVYTEPLAPRDVADAVARLARVAVHELDPIEGLTDESAAAGDDYVTVMRRNLDTLRSTLGCR